MRSDRERQHDQGGDAGDRGTPRCGTVNAPRRVQPRLALFSVRIRGQSSRGPMLARMTGSRVRATATETSGISTPPIPALRRNGTGNDDQREQADPTVSPENSTARPAELIAAWTACSLSCPWARSSRHRVTTSSE